MQQDNYLFVDYSYFCLLPCIYYISEVMMIYRNKSKEEIQSTFQTFQDSFEDKAGEELNIDQLKAYLIELKEKKKLELIDSAFQSFSPVSIDNFIELLNTKDHIVNYTDDYDNDDSLPIPVNVPIKETKRGKVSKKTQQSKEK